MRSVLNLKRRTRETCKTRHSLIFTGHNNKISRGGGGKARVYCKNAKLPWRITTDKYLTIERKAMDSVKSVIRLDNLSEYQFEALSNLLRVRR